MVEPLTRTSCAPRSTIADISQWFAVNLSNVITAVVLLVAGIVLSFLLRMLAVRAVAAAERALPGRHFRTRIPGIAREWRVSDIVSAVVL